MTTHNTERLWRGQLASPDWLFADDPDDLNHRHHGGVFIEGECNRVPGDAEIVTIVEDDFVVDARCTRCGWHAVPAIPVEVADAIEQRTGERPINNTTPPSDRLWRGQPASHYWFLEDERTGILDLHDSHTESGTCGPGVWSDMDVRVVEGLIVEVQCTYCKWRTYPHIPPELAEEWLLRTGQRPRNPTTPAMVRFTPAQRKLYNSPNQ